MGENDSIILVNSRVGLLKRLVALRRFLKPAAVILVLLISPMPENNVFAGSGNEVMAWAPLSAAKLTMAFSQVSFSYGNYSKQASTVPLHHFDISCSNCHGQGDPIGLSRAGRDLNVDINRSCTSFGCHNYDRSMNHPVGMTVDTKVPDFMPLDKNSEMTCLTCHDQNISDDSEQNTQRTLQVKQDQDICASCHEAMNPGFDNSLHWQFSSKAHLGNISPNSDHDTQQVSLASGIDVESRTCVTCHEDVSVTIPQLHETRSQKQLRYKSMTDHPIGMEYADVFARDAGRYKKNYTKFDNVRLFDGKVGCGSCHSLYSKEKGYLITTNEDSELCRKCHIS